MMSGPDLLFFDFVKQFIQRMGCGFTHVNIISIIWDALLSKRYRYKNDPYLVKSLAVMVAALKTKIMPQFQAYGERDPMDTEYVKNMVEFTRLIETHGHSINELEFFEKFKELF